MSFKDHFSGHASAYTQYRPHYPPGLFTWLAALSPTHERAWDCATGNGQAAVDLARYFDEVVATDASSTQIDNAIAHPQVRYAVAPADAAPVPAHSLDLVTVAQALHWFDFDAFYAEVRRVLTPGGHLAVWCYGLLWIEPAIDAVLRHFYAHTIDAYWPAERRYVEEAYRTIPFPFAEVAAPEFAMNTHWDLTALCNYLRTWSAVQRFQQKQGHDPVDALEGELRGLWGERTLEREITWPLHIRVGRV